MTRIQRKRTSSGGTWIVWLALGFTAVCLLLSAWLVSSPDSESETQETEPVRLARGGQRPSPTPSRPAQKAAPPAPRPTIQPAPQPSASSSPTQPAPQEAPMPQEAEPSGPAEGINLYRPGIKPIKQGIIVPDGFELPAGYVRHYQTTDDGQMQKPILMFHPDHKPVDSEGKPVELPANRVVPPELAPPGMPIDILEPPQGPEGVEPIP